MFKIFKSKEEPEQEPTKKSICGLIFSTNVQDELSIVYYCLPGAEDKFVNLLYNINSGKLLDLICQYILETAKLQGQQNTAEDIIKKVKGLIVTNSYEGEANFDEEDPVVSPCNVFKENNGGE